MHNYDNKEFVYDFLEFMAESDFCYEEIIIRYYEGEPIFWVNCSDLHWWGVGYGVQVTKDNFNILKDCVDYNQTEGHLLFCCKEYQMRPQGAYYVHLEPNMWLAFDMCGPLRQSDFMNPEIQKFTDETLQYNLDNYANEMFEYLTYPYINYNDDLVVE